VSSSSSKVWKTDATCKYINSSIRPHSSNSRYNTQLPPSPADFSRFDLYAPFVQSLYVFGGGGRSKREDFGIDASWQTLIFRARQSPLLPNLTTLTLDEAFEKDDEPALWVSAFASKSLKSFYVRKLAPKASGVTSSLTSVLLGLVTQSCPDLQNIRLCLGPPYEQSETSFWDSGPSNAPNLLRIVLGVSASQTWQNIRNLRSLVTDIHAIDGHSLLSLGQLPYLDSLDIHGAEPRHTSLARLPSSIRNLSLSKNTFPSLRRLSIRNLHHEDIMLLWDLESVVQELDQVEIALDIVAEHTLSDKQTLGNRFSSDFLPILSARSPALTKIVIDFNSAHPFDHVDAMPLDIGRFEPLSPLPLQWVELRFICIKAPEGASRIATLWPNVVNLKLPNQPIASDALHHFAVLPHLRHLVLDVFWTTRPWKGPRSVNPDFAMLPLHTLEFSKRPEHELQIVSIEDHAKYVILSPCILTYSH
jgi:hypothetical protein